jgi:threonine synthase
MVGAPSVPPDDDVNPFVAYRRRMAWYAFARARGATDDDTVSLVRDVDDAVRSVDGTGFRVTPFAPAEGVSEALRLDVWVKDETGNVAGSHKARHLMGVLLHLLVAERTGAVRGDRPTLAIASCGNAALAAATLASAVSWPLDVFVPPQADPWVLDRLAALHAHVVTCPRRPGAPPGDPCLRQFRAAVDAGAVPFSVQGPDNGLCLDGGRTLAWEVAAAWGERPAPRLFVQVGGGALASSVGGVLSMPGEHGEPWPLHAVQTAGCAPLARAWHRAKEFGVETAGTRWTDCMQPWETEPVSMATGILDDETYDWLGVVTAMEASGGWPVVASEADVVAAHHLARTATTIPVDPTGSAGLAGVRAMRPCLVDGERVVVLFTGRSRDR